jgi:hypothetical protein
VRSPGSSDFPDGLRLQSSGGVMRVMQLDQRSSTER